ncbi:methylenetetrahydrofolate--tRNA-(uracil(54)-C(5))-methyltransferase (FADH(2)-oxidizing) TrmFO [Spiroplasma endosymbiont of Amphibalanus improvisus]|uniref:methylenetetrahydrofolate--tRNA-(uracil(54)- C(5))-methyltransferase (FADH(2)-oxidizing) TrmFO n=1 Tax=Spiroplasma endosymbiont of Amphibalanus improvisus TaxID=3066327 RepID=UPI00313EB04B
MIRNKTVNVIGAGLSGCEAAYQLAERGYKVNLYEVKRLKKNEVQKTNNLAELVCSNSLRSNNITNAVGLLKKEMQLFDSLIIKVALQTSVPAGGSLAVDRENFSAQITKIIEGHCNINLINQEFIDVNILKTEPTIIATGPLTTAKLQKNIQDFLGKDYFYFYDAVAPIVKKESIDFSKAYYKSRYSKESDSDDYINCPMDKKQFKNFYQNLVSAETIELKEFEKEIFFEGCMPVEQSAKRNFKTLLFGNMKPVGLDKPNGTKNFAVVQLRQDNAINSLYNIVGFQTNLKWPEQDRVFKMIPGLENAEFVRYGVMHKNNFINSPTLLNKHLQLKKQKNIFFIGQITGVEGYVESTATGIIGALNCINFIEKKEMLFIPETSVMGSLVNYIINSSAKNFQPMKANFGILPDVSNKVKFKSKQEKNQAYYERSMTDLKHFIKYKI